MGWRSSTHGRTQRSASKIGLNKREMRKVVMQTAEPFSTIEAIERLVNILASIYVKADLKQAANNTTSDEC